MSALLTSNRFTRARVNFIHIFSPPLMRTETADAGRCVEEEGTHVQQGVNETAEVDAEAAVAARGSDDMSEDTGRGVEEEESTHVE